MLFQTYTVKSTFLRLHNTLLHILILFCLLAVKRGRYTHERKAQNILEVKQLTTGEQTPPKRQNIQPMYDYNSK